MNCSVCGKKINSNKERSYKKVREFKGKTRIVARYCETCNSKLTLTGVTAKPSPMVAVGA